MSRNETFTLKKNGTVRNGVDSTKRNIINMMLPKMIQIKGNKKRASFMVKKCD